MNRTFAIVALAMSGAASAHAADPVQVDGLPELTSLEPVDRITAMTGLHSWTAIDDDTLIVWTTPFRPYLVELSHPSPDLRWAWTIGVSSFGSQIYARFDSIEVGGFRYPIREIYKLSRDDAKAITARS
jgi:hypothetical protein